MEHLEIKSAELWLARPDPLKLYAWHFGKKMRCELAITRELQEKNKILNGTASLTPLTIAKKVKPIIDIWDSDDPQKNGQHLMSEYGDASTEATTAKADDNIFRSYELFTRIEQAPNPDSRITLDTERDSLGMPRATLHWVLTPLEKHSIRKMYELIGQQIGKSGAGRVKLKEYLWDENDHAWPEFTGGGWHHMGTTRMSDDPATGVVDANCKVHGIANLHIAGASCYTTAAAPNPTLTVIALSLRLSDRIKKLV
jgi:choline dehydrogenase-like flavoprotein